MLEDGVDYQVAKKTLIRRAIKEVYGVEVEGEHMEGPVGMAFGYKDIITACKNSKEFAEEFEEFEILGGIVEKKLVSKEEIDQPDTFKC